MRIGSIVQTNWDWRAAGNFMLGGTGSALIFMTALASFPDTPPQLLGYISLAVVATGLGLVWLEIGRPWRFLNVFFHPKTSWMTREASVAVVLFILTLAGILLKQSVVIVLAGLTGLAFLYCQARILKAAKGIPAWRTQAIVPLIMTTGLSEGTAVLILVLIYLSASINWVIYILLVLVISRIMAWRYYRNKLIVENAPEGTLKILHKVSLNYELIGNIIPAIFAGIALMISAYSATLIIISCVLVVFSGWHVKFIIVTRAAHVQGFALGTPKLRGQST